MRGEKSSRVEWIVNGGGRLFAAQEKECAIVDANGTLKSSALAGAMMKPAKVQEGEESRELDDVPEAHKRFSSIAIQDAQMSFAQFVETKFVPEHVQYKTRAGQTHYQAMLKHLISPKAVGEIFNAERGVRARLSAVPGWPYLDGLRLCDLRPEHIRRIVAAADKAGYSPQTVKHIKNVCFAIVAHAQKEGCFHGPNPASLVKLSRVTRSTSPTLSTEQVKMVLDLLQYPHREVALFALTTGMNLPDICDVRWKHVNVEEFESLADGRRLPGRSLLVKAWWNCAGLGDNRACGKNKIVEIRDPLLSTLRELRKNKPLWDPEDLVLVSNTGDRIIPAGFWVSELKRVAKLLNMPKLTWQDIRRAPKVLPAEPLTHFSDEVSWSAQRLCANWPRTEPPSWQEVLRQDNFKSDSDVRRTSCFGRRLRVSSALGVNWTTRAKSDD